VKYEQGKKRCVREPFVCLGGNGFPSYADGKEMKVNTK
jgi:hypothetical protein